MLNKPKVSVALVSVLLVLLAFASAVSIGTANAAPKTITAYKSTIAVNINSPYSASQWTDTASMKEPASGITFAVKQNGTGWLFLMIWQQSPGICSDAFCYGGIEIGPLTNTGEMGTPTTPTIMILGSTSFQASVGHTVDEFISTGDQIPASVESLNYATQSVCGTLSLTGTTYTVQCYRPFTLKNASPYDFPTLGVGSTIEVGFAIGEFNSPGTHDASDMGTYALTFSASTYSGSSTTSTTPTTTTTTTSTTKTTTTSTTTTSSTTPTTTTSTTTTTPTTTTATSTTPTTTSTTTTTKSTTSTTTTTSSTTSTTPTTTTTATSYTITTSFTVPGTSSSTTSTTSTSPTTSTTSTTKTTSTAVTTPTTTVTTTVATTVTGPTTTITPATQTVTSSVTATSTLTQPAATSTVTKPAVTTTMTTTSTTNSTSVPSWAYGVMVVLLILGLAIGYVVAGPRLRGPSIRTGALSPR